METYVVFADRRLQEPITLLANWPKFDLLFNYDGDEFLLRQAWDPTADPAFFVLSVSRIDLNGTAMLEVKQHPESPASLDMCCDSCAEAIYWVRGKAFIRVPVALGQVFTVTYSKEPMPRKDVGMMFKVRDGRQDDEDPLQARQLCLEDLPPEVFEKPLRMLSSFESVFVLPFVNPRMFNVVKARRHWAEVNFTNGVCPNVSTLADFLSNARETCESLQVRGGFLCPDLSHDMFWNMCQTLGNMSVRWVKLAELHLCGLGWGDECNVVLRAMRENQNYNFPNLTALTLVESSGTSWSSLRRCGLLKLKSLKIAIYPPESREPAWDPDELWGQFGALETLIVEFKDYKDFDEASRVFPQPRPYTRPLPCLKTLMVHNLPRNNAGSIQDELRFFETTPIERLGLYNLPKREGTAAIPASWLFNVFCRVVDLSFDSSVFVDWVSAPEGSLKRLLRVRVPMREKNGIPFEKMANLEGVFVELVSAGSTITFCLDTITRLPKLVAVKLTASGPATVVIRADCSSSGIRSLDLDTNIEGFATLGTFLGALPILARFVLSDVVFGRNFTTETFRQMVGSLIDDRRLVELECRGLGACDYFHRAVSSSGFSGTGWELRYVAPSSIVFRSRTTKDRLEPAMVVFDDPLFQPVWLLIAGNDV